MKSFPKREFTTIHLMYTLEKIRILGSDIPQRQSEERHFYQPANRFLSFPKLKKKKLLSVVQSFFTLDLGKCVFLLLDSVNPS